MKRLLTILFLFFFVEGNSQLVSFIYHGDTVFAYNPLTKDSFKVRNFSKSEVGLSNVDNTSDLNKPVSNQQLNFLSQLTNDSSLFASSQTDQSVKLRQFRDDPSIKQILFANGDVVINDTVNLNGKILEFRNGSKLKGIGTVSNLFVSSPVLQQVFDTTLKVVHINNPTVEVAWFGAKADCPLQNEFGITDNWRPFRNALDAMYEYNGTDAFDYFYTKRLHIPSQGNKSYYISKELIISGNIEIYGDGQLSTILNWPRGVRGLVLPSTQYPVPNFYTAAQQARRCYLHDFTMSGYKGAMGFFPGYYDSTSNGLTLYGGEHIIDRLNIQGWQGHGVYVYGGNESTFQDVQSNYNSGCGFYFTTADGNANMLLRCMAKHNAQAGFLDSSFLGNTAIMPSTAGNAADNPFQRSIVYNRDTTMSYSCIKANANVEPEHTVGWQNFWVPTLSIGFFNHAWDSTIKYVPGGSAFLYGQNQIGVWIGGYSEGDQYAGINNSISFVIGGFWSGMDNSTMRHGSWPTFRNVAASNVTKGVYTILDGDKNQLSFYDSRFSNRIGFQYDTTLRNLSFVSNGVVNGPYFAWKNSALNSGRASYSSSIDYSAVFLNGVWLGITGTSLHRNIVFGNAAPSSGQWALGDFVIDATADSTTLGYKCTKAGDFALTPPIFSKIQTNVPTKMTTTQRNAIISPQEGLMIYDMSLHKLFVWDGTLWEAAW